MTQPPLDPAGTPPATDPTPTEPVPPLVPPAMPSPSAGAGPAGPSAPQPPRPAFAFTPADPEPLPADAWLPPVAAAPGPAQPPGRRATRPGIVNLVLGAAILVAAVGVAFAIGRVTAPEAASVGTRQELGAGPGFDDGRNGSGNGAPGPGGAQPAPSFDGSGGVPGFDGSDGVFPGRGAGRDGFGGLGLAGTVTEVTPDSVTIQLDSGLTVTVGLDESTTYHQQAPATASDVAAGDRIQVQVSGGVRPGRSADGSIDLGTAGDITIVP